MTRLLRRLRYLLRRDHHERELDDELRFHLDMKQQELESRGVERATAAASARRALGNLPLTRDNVRDVWIAPWLRSAAQDVRFAGRLLLRERGFTLAVVVVLGVGMALTGAMYTVVNAILFGSLPGDDGERIVSLGTRDAQGRTAGVSLADFEDWRDGNETFDGMAVMFGTSLNVSDDEIAPEMVVGGYVSHDAFRLLRTPPLLGRDFLPADDVDGAPGTAILSHGLWMSRYGGDPDVIGRTIRVNDRPSVLIGVMPEGFAFPFATAVWAPVGPTFGGSDRGRDARTHQAFGRLADGVSLPRAQADLDVVAARLAERYPETNAGIRPTAVRFAELVSDDEKSLLLALLGGVVFVLLIACANVANLLLSRSARRAREMSLRVSLGATRWRLVRQLLVESVLLAGMAGLAGAALTGLAIRLVTTQLGGPGAYWIEYSMDGRVLALVAATCLAAGLACGVAPALHASRTNVIDRLKDGGRTGSGAAGLRARRWATGLLTAEVALTLVLLAGTGLMVRSFLALHEESLAVDAEGLTTMGVRLSSAKYPTPGERRAFYEEVEARLGTVGAVDAFTMASVNPLGFGYARSLSIDGRPAEAGVEPPRVTYVTVGSDYFRTLGLPVLRGRAFTRLDGTAGHENAVVNERFATMFFPDGDPIGRRIRLTNPNVMAEELPWLTIVGVSPTVRQMARTGGLPDPVVYYPFRGDSGFFARLIVRSSPGSGVVAAIREEMRRLSPDLPLFAVGPLEEAMAGSRWNQRSLGALLGMFAVVGLLLAAVGVYAVVAYSVAQRTHEIGIRIALGATAAQVVRSVCRRAAAPLGLGLLAGLAGAGALGRTLEAFLVGIEPFDAATLLVVAALLAGVVLVASLVPARRASGVDPLTALRCE